MLLLQTVKGVAKDYEFAIPGFSHSFQRGDYVSAENVVEEWLIHHQGHPKFSRAMVLYNLCHLCFDLLWAEEEN